MRKEIPKTVDEYMAAASPNVIAHLQRLRAAILEIAPEAQEYIGYEMSAYKLYDRVFVYFAGFGKHVSLFPGPEAIVAFQEDLKDYKTAKGTIQFPLDKPIPLALVKKILRFKVEKNREKATIGNKR